MCYVALHQPDEECDSEETQTPFQVKGIVELRE